MGGFRGGPPGGGYGGPPGGGYGRGGYNNRGGMRGGYGGAGRGGYMGGGSMRGPGPDVEFLPVDREKVCPMLVRMFVKFEEHFEDRVFTASGQPVDDEVRVHTWRDATIGELTELLAQVRAPCKAPAPLPRVARRSALKGARCRQVHKPVRAVGTRCSFKVVQLDHGGKGVSYFVGNTALGRGVRDDVSRRALGQIRFQVGLAPPPLPHSRINWTRRVPGSRTDRTRPVPPPVLTGHANEQQVGDFLSVAIITAKGQKAREEAAAKAAMEAKQAEGDKDEEKEDKEKRGRGRGDDDDDDDDEAGPDGGKEADPDGGNKEGAAEDAAEADGGKGGDKAPEEAGAADATAAAE
jgi:histone deacetylase complex subunit SAP18